MGALSEGFGCPDSLRHFYTNYSLHEEATELLALAMSRGYCKKLESLEVSLDASPLVLRELQQGACPQLRELHLLPRVSVEDMPSVWRDWQQLLVALDLKEMSATAQFNPLKTISQGELPSLRKMHINHVMDMFDPDDRDNYPNYLSEERSRTFCRVVADVLRQGVCPKLESLSITQKGDRLSMGRIVGGFFDAGLSHVVQGLADGSTSDYYSSLRELVLTEETVTTSGTAMGPLSCPHFLRALSSGMLDHLIKLHIAVDANGEANLMTPIVNGLRRCHDLVDLHLVRFRSEESVAIREALRSN